MEMLGFETVTDGPYKKNAKYADLYTVPDGWVGEIVDGDLYASPRPRVIHGTAMFSMAIELGRYFRDTSRRGWVIVMEAELHLGKDILVPDLAGWRRSRMPKAPDTAAVRLAPDWVCEGLSPSTAKLDKGRKRELYAKAGVGHLWFADPDRKEIDVLSLQRKQYVIAATVTTGRKIVAPFSKAIDLDLIWQR